MKHLDLTKRIKTPPPEFKVVEGIGIVEVRAMPPTGNPEVTIRRVPGAKKGHLLAAVALFLCTFGGACVELNMNKNMPAPVSEGRKPSAPAAPPTEVQISTDDTLIEVTVYDKDPEKLPRKEKASTKGKVILSIEQYKALQEPSKPEPEKKP